MPHEASQRGEYLKKPCFCLRFFVLVFLRGTMIVRAGHFAAQTPGPGVFLTRLLWRFNPDLLGVILSYSGFSDGYFFGHRNTLAFIHRHLLARSFDVDVDISLGLHAAAKNEVESKKSNQDNDNDGDGSNAAA